MTDQDRAAVSEAMRQALGPLERAVHRQTIVLVVAMLVVGALAGARLHLRLPGGVEFDSTSHITPVSARR